MSEPPRVDGGAGDGEPDAAGGADWYKVAEPDDLEEGRVRTAVAGPRTIALTRCEAGTGPSTTTVRIRADPWVRGPSRTACCGVRGTATTTTRSRAVLPRASATPRRRSPWRSARTASTSPSRRDAPRADGFGPDGGDHGRLGHHPRVRHGRPLQSRLRRRHAPCRGPGRPDLCRHPARRCGVVRRLRLREADRSSGGVFRHRRSRVDQPLDRALRRQGGPGADPGGVRPGALQGAGGGAPSRISTCPGRSATWPTSGRPSCPTRTMPS